MPSGPQDPDSISTYTELTGSLDGALGVDTGDTSPVIEIGEVVSDFELLSQEGTPVHLSDVLAAHKAVVLSFYLFDFSGG